MRFLTVFQIPWLGVVSSSHNRKLNLLKALALEACTLLQTLFRIGKLLTLYGPSADSYPYTFAFSETYLQKKELERNSMRSVDFVLEMEHLDIVGFVGRLLLLGYSFCINIRELVQVQDWMLSQRFTVELVGIGLVNPNSTAFLLVRQVSLLDQRLYQVVDRASLGHQNVEMVLNPC